MYGSNSNSNWTNIPHYHYGLLLVGMSRILSKLVRMLNVLNLILKTGTCNLNTNIFSENQENIIIADDS